MVRDTSLRNWLLAVAALGGLVGYHRWTNRVREFRGTLQCRLTDVKPAVIGYPCWPATLVTATQRLPLGMSRIPDYRARLTQLDGQAVIVHGVLRTWRGRYRSGQQWIDVREIQIESASTPRPVCGNSGRPRPIRRTSPGRLPPLGARP